MSLVRFDASNVITEHPEGTCHFVGFTDGSDAPVKYLLLQRDLADTVGPSNYMDVPHFEWCDQISSGYGLIEEAKLSADALDLALSTKGQDVLRGVTQLRILFNIPAQAHERLQESLTHIFRNTSRLQIAAA